MQAVQNFRTNVRVAMARLNISQVALAEKAEVSRPHLNRILKDREKPVDPSLEVCDKIATALGMSVGELTEPPRKFLKICSAAIA